MLRPASRALVIWLFGACLAAADGGSAQAQAVVLVRPSESDAELLDISNRVEAELNLHGFTPLAREGTLEPDPAAALRSAARNSNAPAAVGFTREAGEASVQVWLIDRKTRSEALRSLTLAPRTSDAPSLIAVRAVDLLRAAFQDFPRPPPPAVVPLPEPAPEPAPEPPSEPQREPEPEPESTPREPSEPLPPARPWSLALAGTLQWPGSEFGVSYGPALAILYRPLAFLQLGLWLSAPSLGAPMTTTSGSASVYRELVFLETRFVVLRAGGFSLAPLLGLGMAFLQAEGEVQAPLQAQSDSVFGGVGLIGVHLEQGLGHGFGLGLSLRALGHMPALGVAVASEGETLQFPVLEAALGFAVEL